MVEVLLGALVLVAWASEPQEAPTVLTSADFASRAPSWSPDGSMIAFESNHDGSWDIDILDVESGAVRHVTTGV